MSTRKRIIEAATQLYAEKGYHGMTMKEIAQKVGIKTPSLYAFFDSKADIFLHIYQDTLNRHLQVANGNIVDNQHLSLKERLESLLRAIIAYQYNEALQMKIYIRLLLFPPDISNIDLKGQLLEVEKKEHALLSQLFKQGMENGEIRAEDSDALATSFLCLMDGLFWMMQRNDEESFRVKFSVIWEQYWQGIQAS